MKIKAFFSVFLISFLIQTTHAQNKKYVLLEHFTNTKCGICAIKNPGFYTTIAQYPNDVHHLSIHPSVPYSTCKLYQANTVENEARADYYGVTGTPQIYLNGNSAAINAQLGALIQSHVADESPIAIKVEQTGTGNTRHGKITITTNTVLPAGNYKLFVAELEKILNYASPNGEQVHHDVFRKMWGGGSGMDVVLPTPSTPTVIEQDFTIAATWVASEIYLLAYLQNIDTKEILNSGSQFDPIVSATAYPELMAQKLTTFPNPTSEELRIMLENDVLKSIELFSITGKRVKFESVQNSSSLDLRMNNLSSGIYLLKVQGENGTYTQKIVKN